ncbi:hypothetical protein GGF50DRAFT_121844 [Schizophyllum commune]
MPFRSPVRFLLLAIFDCRPHVVTPPYQCPGELYAHFSAIVLSSDNACKRSTTCWTTGDWSPARLVIRVARNSLACSSQAKNAPPMKLVQASKSHRQCSEPEVMPVQAFQDIFLPLGKAKKLHFDAKCAEVRAGAPS